MKDFFASLRKEKLIFTGVITPYIKKLPQTVISLLAREEVVAANAALTAEGILAMVIQNTPRSLPETIRPMPSNSSRRAIWNSKPSAVRCLSRMDSAQTTWMRHRCAKPAVTAAMSVPSRVIASKSAMLPV